MTDVNDNDNLDNGDGGGVRPGDSSGLDDLLGNDAVRGRAGPAPVDVGARLDDGLGGEDNAEWVLFDGDEGRLDLQSAPGLGRGAASPIHHRSVETAGMACAGRESRADQVTSQRPVPGSAGGRWGRIRSSEVSRIHTPIQHENPAKQRNHADLPKYY